MSSSLYYRYSKGKRWGHNIPTGIKYFLKKYYLLINNGVLDGRSYITGAGSAGSVIFSVVVQVSRVTFVSNGNPLGVLLRAISTSSKDWQELVVAAQQLNLYVSCSVSLRLVIQTASIEINSSARLEISSHIAFRAVAQIDRERRWPAVAL